MGRGGGLARAAGGGRGVLVHKGLERLEVTATLVVAPSTHLVASGVELVERERGR